MAGNPSKNLRAEAASIQRHIELVQPRKSLSTPLTATTAEANGSKMDERAKIREKIMVRAGKREGMALQQIKARAGSGPGGKGKNSGAKGESRLIPASGGMGMSLD